MMLLLPHWLIRLLITFGILWLVWALVVAPWMFSTDTFLKTHYWWMLP